MTPSTLAIFAFASAASAPPTAVALDEFAARILAAHNNERALARVAPLRWDPALAAGAAAYAQYLATAGLFVHSDRRARPGISENLWTGIHGYRPEQMVGLWMAEKRYFTPGIFPNVSRTGNWVHVSHYSQVIWPTTSRLGCGRGWARGREVLVCRYAPKGNVDGRRVP